MAKTHGKDASVETGTTLITETTGWTLDESADVADQSAQGDAVKTYLVGMNDWTATIDALLDPADTSGQVSMTIGSAATVHFFPEGQVSLDADWSGAAIITGVSVSAPMGDIVKTTITLQGNGALDKTGTVA